MTKLEPVIDPYASVVVATYEPIILAWLSRLTLGVLRNDLLARSVTPVAGAPTDQVPTIGRFRWRRKAIPAPPATPPGRTPGGMVSAMMAAAAGTATQPTYRLAPTAILDGPAVTRGVSAEENKRRIGEVERIFAQADLNPTTLREELTKHSVAHLLGERVELILSPIGVMHLYRQLYFDAGAALGPLEQVFAVAPAEVLELLVETSHRMTSERVEQFGAETTLENQLEQTNTDEISDQVQSTITRDMSVGISAHAEGNAGVYSGGGSIDLSLGLSSEQSRTSIRNRLRTTTRRSSETIRKTYSLTVRNVAEIAERSVVRRVIRNESTAPINYGLRRVLRKVRIKVQSLGPRLVWQLYVSRPGGGLADGRLVMFREADPVVTPGLPPTAPPRPEGGVESGSQTVAIETGPEPDIVTIAIPKDPDREITALVMDSIVDASPEGKEPTAPALLPQQYPRHDTAEKWIFTFAIARGDASRATVNYSFHWEPSDKVMTAWQVQVDAARAAYDAVKLEEQFERAKRIITAKSKISPRPSADLRGEERYEILNRLISEAFQTDPREGFPGPVEIELFHRYFDINAMFYYVHPSWWRPRYQLARDSYELTDESEPAKFGKSLGWLIQLDGDRRRNEFLNSPWVRTCLPIRPGLESAAIRWMADHFEGRRGFNTAPDSPLGKMLADIEAQRAAELLGSPGPDYVTLDGEVAPSRADSATAYPVIDEFEVMVPTEGFVYDLVTMD